MPSRTAVIAVIIATFTLLVGVAFAQDDESAAAADTAGSVMPQDYPLDELATEIRPLRVESLTEVADLWIKHLQAAVAAEAELILGGDATGEQLATAETRRTAVNARLSAVVDELEAKGGDVAEYRDYMRAVRGTSMDWFAPQAVSEYAVTWVTSPEGGIRVAVNILKFVAILIVAWITAKLVSGIARSAIKRLPKTSTLLQEFVVKITKRAIMIVGFVVALSALGVNITPLVAAIGAAGLVIGLALQGTLSNFASGILILVYRPFDVGDVIDAGSVAGKVEAMNLVSTRMLTFDNQVQYVPNNLIWNGVITNITGRDTRRVDMTFGIGYADDMAKAESIIRELIASHGKVLAAPEPVIKVHELADSSVNFIARPWSKTADYWDVFWDVTRQVKERFDAEGVGIPFPQQDIHVPDELRVVVSNS